VIRAVVDTNVLVSALISPTGNEARILLAMRQGLVKPFFSEQILQEYAEVLARPKFAFPADEIDALIELLRSRGERSTIQSRSIPICRIPEMKSFWRALKPQWSISS
jgi:uncharacterized protein